MSAFPGQEPGEGPQAKSGSSPGAPGAQEADRSAVRYSARRTCQGASYGAGFGIDVEPRPEDYNRAYLTLSCDSADTWGFRTYRFDYDTRQEAGRALAGHFEAVILAAITASRPVHISYREEYRYGRYDAYITGVGIDPR